MKLSFSNGKFVLIGSSLSVGTCLFPWTPEDGKCVTTDFKAAARFRDYADERAEKILDRAFVKHYSLPARPLPPFLDTHQIEGVRFILGRSRSYLAHAPGAGKTVQAIVASLWAKGGGQTVFIVPPSLTANWAREIEHWTLQCGTHGPVDWVSIAVVPDSSRQVYTGWKSDFIIVPDSMLTKQWVLDSLIQLKKKFVAVDEASRFKEPTAQRTIALFGGTLNDGRVTPGFALDSPHTVLLDGSPMPNRSMELWAPTYAMCPEAIDFMSREDFGFRYCGAEINKRGVWEFKHSARERELSLRLQKDFMHVVTEDRLNHPERRRSMLFMNEDARSPAHRAWERKNLHHLKLDDISESTSQGELATFRRELGLRKAPWVADYVASRLRDREESILLFAWHRSVIFALEKDLEEYGPIVVMGGTDAEVREKDFERFQSGKKKLIIGNISAMGRGHNLQRADRVIFAEYAWNDELNKQCEKRASRMGRNQELFVRCDYVICPNSMDEIIMRSVFTKAERIKKVIG